MLIAAMNPCPCGMNDAKLGCRCRPDEIRRYRGKISGPLLDRIDMQVEVLRLSEDELSNVPNGESSSIVRKRVIAARKIQLERYKALNIYCNADMHSKDIQKYCKLDAGGEGLLRQAINRFRLSPRAYDRILKVARTIADLAGIENIRQEHLLEAVNYRQLDRLQW
jgi:magnesium chelatase family protein